MGIVGDGLGGGECLGVLLQALDAEQLGDDRVAIVSERADRPTPLRSRAARPVPASLDRSHVAR
jgi:hypothetical protein